MATFSTSAPLSTGSLAIDASLIAGGILRKGCVSLCAEQTPLQILSCMIVKANQSQQEQTLLVEMGLTLDDTVASRSGVTLSPMGNGAGVTRIKDNDSSTQLATLKAMIMLGAFNLIVILVGGDYSQDSGDIDAMILDATSSGAACVLVSPDPSIHECKGAIGKITLSSVTEIETDEKKCFGWRLEGCTQSTLPDRDEEDRYFSTLITSNYEVFKPFDLVAAGLVSGVLTINDLGKVQSNGRDFTDSFDAAVSRLHRIDIQARLQSAVITALPFVRL